MSQDGSFSDLDAIEKEALAAVEAAGDAEALDQVRIQVLGKKGSLKQILRNLGGLTLHGREPGVVLGHIAAESCYAVGHLALKRLEGVDLSIRRFEA